MKRLPVVFLSLFILATCVLLAGSDPHIGMAATDRTIPWWWGDEYSVYWEYECTDGLALWVNPPDYDDTGPKIRIVAELMLDGSILIDEVRQMEEIDFGWYGEYVFEWSHEIPPGSKVRLKLDTHKNKPNGFDYHDTYLWIEDCTLPKVILPNWIQSSYGEHGYGSSLLRTPVNSCEIYEILIEPSDTDYNNVALKIDDLDIGLKIGSAPAAYVSAMLESPSGTQVQLFDKNHKAAFQLGTTASEYDTPLPDFILDDDSIYSLDSASRPFNKTSFAPSPGNLSAFNGEEAAGTWKLKICNSIAPESQQVFVGRNMSFEQGNSEWVQSSTNERSLIYSQSDPNLQIAPKDGQWLAWLGGVNNESSSLEQVIKPPQVLERFEPYLRFWYQIRSSDDCSDDYAYLKLDDHLLEAFPLCVQVATSDWVMHEIDLRDAGAFDEWPYPEEHTFQISVDTDSTGLSSFYIDNIGWVYKNPGTSLEAVLFDFTQDFHPPKISQIGIESIADDKVIIRWQTDEPASSRVHYGTDPGALPLNQGVTTLVTNHAIALTNLVPDTVYYYVIETTDEIGNTAQSDEGSFETQLETLQFTLNVTNHGQGTVAINPNNSLYDSGQVVTLTAVPDNGYLFTGWSGDASGMETPIQITMNGNKSVTASFAPVAPNTYTLNTPSSVGGSIDRNPDKPAYQSGEVVTLTAVPATGYLFNGWSGDASGMETPIQITMNGNKSITASFAPVAPNTYTLNTPSSAGGSIDRNPDKQTFQSGEVVTLTAVPVNGYQFGGWNGDASGWGNPIQITMDSNKSVGATFAPIGNSDNFIYFMPLIIR